MGRATQDGFSLIELIAVIAILGILVAVAVPRLMDNQAYADRGYADEVANALRYARNVAIASECEVRITLDDTGYAAVQRAPAGNSCSAGGAWNTAVVRNDGTALAGQVPGNVLAGPAAGKTITFDGTGRVTSGAAAPNLTSGPFTIAIDAASGWVTVQ